MALKQVIEILDLLETPTIKRAVIQDYFMEKGLNKAEIKVREVRGDKGKTDFIKIYIPGTHSRITRVKASTLGIIGRLGGIGARPYKIGLVSDADGAITALASAAKIAEMREKGDCLRGDVIVTTHLCPDSPIIPHDPVDFMDSPVSIKTMNEHEVDERMEAILAIDTTKGNRVINHKGFAISPTVKDGYILRVSEDLLDIMQTVTGKLPVVFPLTIQDITPYGNELYHLNSILQPANATHAPVVGVAITTEVPVPGCATGANHPGDIESAVRFVVEVAKAYGEGKCSFYDKKEFQKILSLYGSLEHLKTLGKK